MARVRSPNYPALSLPDAVSRVRDVHKAQQTTPEPRDVVVKHMGYGSVNGRALKSLSALIKYGLLEDAGDGLRVSDRAIAILFPDPDDPTAKQQALLDAAKTPALYAGIFDRWDGRPSEDSLEAYLIRNGFNANAVGAVARAFFETWDLVSDIQESYEEDELEEVEEEPRNDTEETMKARPTPPEKKAPPAAVVLNSTKPVFDFETVKIATEINNQDDLDELIKRLEQIKVMLPSKPTEH